MVLPAVDGGGNSIRNIGFHNLCYFCVFSFSSCKDSAVTDQTDNFIICPTFKFGDKEYESQLAQDLFIDRSNLSGEYEAHASRFAWYSTAYELAMDAELRLKADLERGYAQLDAQARASMTSQGLKITEKKVENMVITQPDYVALQTEYLDAKRNTGLLKAARDALIHRRDMLIGLGANYRAETQSDLSLREQDYKTTYNNRMNKR